MNPWTYLIIAGVFEICFTSCLKLTNGFSQDRWPYIVGFVVSALLSFFFLSKGMQGIPLGTAYAVWTGIGAAGTAAIGIFFFNDPTNLARMLCLTLLIGSIVGLKLFST